MLVLLQGEVPGAAKQATLAVATAAKQGTAGTGAVAPTLSPAKDTPRGKENVTPDRDQVSTLLGDSGSVTCLPCLPACQPACLCPHGACGCHNRAMLIVLSSDATGRQRG